MSEQAYGWGVAENLPSSKSDATLFAYIYSMHDVRSTRALRSTNPSIGVAQFNCAPFFARSPWAKRLEEVLFASAGALAGAHDARAYGELGVLHISILLLCACLSPLSHTISYPKGAESAHAAAEAAARNKEAIANGEAPVCDTAHTHLCFSLSLSRVSPRAADVRHSARRRSCRATRSTSARPKPKPCRSSETGAFLSPARGLFRAPQPPPSTVQAPPPLAGGRLPPHHQRGQA
jgi:hypothetical protein